LPVERLEASGAGVELVGLGPAAHLAEPRVELVRWEPVGHLAEPRVEQAASEPRAQLEGSGTALKEPGPRARLAASELLGLELAGRPAQSARARPEPRGSWDGGRRAGWN
jgi:hypothetical protein